MVCRFLPTFQLTSSSAQALQNISTQEKFALEVNK